VWVWVWVWVRDSDRRGERATVPAGPIVTQCAMRLPQVSIGGISCSDIRASDDGAWLHALTPNASQLGCSAATDCGYKLLTIANPSISAASSGTSRARSLGASAALGATLSCPPFCTESNVDGIVPALSTANGSFLAAAVSADGALAPLVVAAADTSSTGVFVAASCESSASECADVD
jgi:hypothetical protein